MACCVLSCALDLVCSACIFVLCVFMYVCVCMCVLMCIHVYARIFIVCSHVGLCVYVFVSVCFCVCVHTLTCMYLLSMILHKCLLIHGISQLLQEESVSCYHTFFTGQFTLSRLSVFVFFSHNFGSPKHTDYVFFFLIGALHPNTVLGINMPESIYKF